jgi:hypothetical protein
MTIDEDKYAIPWAQRSPLVPDVDTLYAWQRNGNARIQMNRMEDKVIESGNAWGTPVGDKVWKWENFQAMIEAEYESNLQDTIDANPKDAAESLPDWWRRITNTWLAPYFTAHNSPTNLLDGWEGPAGNEYIPPYGEPIAGLLPVE